MQESGFFHEADEWYSGTLARVEDGEDYGYGPTIKLIIHLDGDVDDGGTQRETWAMASQKLSPRSKLYGWVNGIDPNLLPENGETLDLATLEDRRVDIMFEHGLKGDGTTKEVVSKVRTSKTKAPKTPAPTKAELEEPF